MKQRMHPGRTRTLSLLAAFVLVTGLTVVTFQSVFAAGTLTNLSWAVLNNQAAATSTNYSYSFKNRDSWGDQDSHLHHVGGGTRRRTPIVLNPGIGVGTVSIAGQVITER
jgi:hypothetical protein